MADPSIWDRYWHFDRVASCFDAAGTEDYDDSVADGWRHFFEALPPEARPAFDLRSFLMSFWISPRLHPDFGWAWITRFLVYLGNALGLLYILYFLQDVVGYSSDEAEDRVFLLTAVYAMAVRLDLGTARR